MPLAHSAMLRHQGAVSAACPHGRRQAAGMHPRLDVQLGASNPSSGGVIRNGRPQPRVKKADAPQAVGIFLTAGASGHESGRRIAMRKLRDIPAVLAS